MFVLLGNLESLGMMLYVEVVGSFKRFIIFKEEEVGGGIKNEDVKGVRQKRKIDRTIKIICVVEPNLMQEERW